MIIQFEVYIPDNQLDKIEDIEENLISVEEYIERSIMDALKNKNIDGKVINHFEDY